MKPKPTEAQITNLWSLWRTHLNFYKGYLPGQATYEDMVYDLISHNIAYVYEQQFDVDVTFIFKNGLPSPVGVEVAGEYHDVSGHSAHNRGRTHNTSNIDRILKEKSLRSKREGKLLKLPDIYVNEIGRRWINYLESDHQQRTKLDAIKDDYLFPANYTYTIYSTEPSINFRQPDGIAVKVNNSLFLKSRVPFELTDEAVLETYCRNKINRFTLPSPNEEEINRLGKLWQTYMISTLTRKEAFKAALDYEFQFNVETKFLYPKDRPHWEGGPTAVEINGMVFEADLVSEFNDAILDETDPNWFSIFYPNKEPLRDPREPSKEIIYEYGMLYIDFLDEDRSRKRRQVLRNKMRYLRRRYNIREEEVKPFHHTTHVDGIIIGDIMFLSKNASDHYIKNYCDSQHIVNEVIRSDGSMYGTGYPCERLTGNMIFVRKKPDFSSYPEFEFEGRKLKKYLGSATDVVIPEGVMIIGEEAFTENETVIRIQIPKTVYEINASAFRGCNSLKEIVVDPDNNVYDSRDNCNGIVLTEKNRLLVGCTNTVIPETVESIGDNAYQYLNRVTEIRIPASIRYVTAKAFDGCCNLKRISVDEKNPVYDSRDNCNAIIRTKPNELIVGCAATAIPDTVTALGSYVFPQGTRLSSITIPKNITKLHSSKIFDIVFGEYTFDGIDCLEEIIVDKENPVYDSREGCSAIIETASNKLIKGCMNTVIPKTVTAIGNEAFRNCRGLETVRIHSGIKEIGTCAFRNCDDLSTVEFEDGITSIGMDVFAFCEKLKSVIFPDSVTDLEGGVLYDCKSLVSAVLPSKITELKMSFFYNCEQLKSIVIPDEVRDIGETAFAGCKNLTTVTFSKSLNHIGAHAFWNCESLTEMHLPDNVTWIEYGAFEGCSELKEVTLPGQLTTVSSRAFDYCQKLESIHIPANLEYVGSLFSHCDSLSKITVDPNNKMYDSRDDCNALIETRRNNLVLGCKTTVIPSSVREIGVAAFEGIDSLTSIEIPEGVVSISSLAFRYCRNLESVILPESLERIDEYSFAGCPKLKHVEIRNPKMYINPEAFRGSPFQPEYKE